MPSPIQCIASAPGQSVVSCIYSIMHVLLYIYCGFILSNIIVNLIAKVFCLLVSREMRSRLVGAWDILLRLDAQLQRRNE